MLKKLEEKIQNKIKSETLREMIETRASWYTLSLYLVRVIHKANAFIK